MLRQIARGAPAPLWRKIYAVPNPGAGNDITISVEPHKAWQLLGVSVTLATSSTAGNRLPALTLRDAGNITLASIVSPTAITASLAPRVSWVTGVGAANVVAASFAVLTLPTPWYMLPGESLTITGHTHASDAWTDCRLTVLETNTGDPQYRANLEQGIVEHAQAIAELSEGF